MTGTTNCPDLIVDGDMSGNITSTVVSPASKHFSVSLDWVGTAIGSFSFQVSNDNVSWTSLKLTGAITANGVADNAFIDVNASAGYFRVVYTSTSGTGTLQSHLVGETNTEELVKVSDDYAVATTL
jgi:hypothetical protein